MSTERKVRLTAEGKDRLEQELDHLRNERIPELSRMIQEMTGDGDVSDNSEYEEMKDEYMHLENRVYDLETTLEHAEIITPGSGDGSVQLGSKVTVRDDDGIEEEWLIVDSYEARSSENRVSDDSPVGKALIGCRAGDAATVETPGGAFTYTIVDVE
ncbi:MAG TPA: transcription elongation factor GreA [Thermomicrobiales bacterium]|nr:transcription elongation factor GreA [Thermomicrobiales bacterium]